MTYFDRYFAFAVPLEDVSDSLVGEAYGQLVDGGAGSALELLSSELAGKSSLILTKLDGAYRARPEGGSALLKWLRDHVQDIPDIDALLPPLKIAEALGESIFESLTPLEQLEIVHGAGTDIAKLSFVASLVVRVSTRRTDVEPSDDYVDPAIAELARLVTEHLTQLGTLNPLRYDYTTSQLIWDLRWIDPDSVRNWVRRQAAAGSWPLLDFAARLVTTRDGDGRSGERIITGVEIDAIDALVGVEALLSELSGGPPAAKVSPAQFDRWAEIPASDENRRTAVRTRLEETRVAPRAIQPAEDLG